MGTTIFSTSDWPEPIERRNPGQESPQAIDSAEIVYAGDGLGSRIDAGRNLI
ncbi:MAG: hypothetical protein NVSMB14_07820 [Isosphaeraceae bacterium]